MFMLLVPQVSTWKVSLSPCLCRSSVEDKLSAGTYGGASNAALKALTGQEFCSYWSFPWSSIIILEYELKEIHIKGGEGYYLYPINKEPLKDIGIGDRSDTLTSYGQTILTLKHLVFSA